MNRRITQLIQYQEKDLIVACDDGTLWQFIMQGEESHWQLLGKIPLASIDFKKPEEP